MRESLPVLQLQPSRPVGMGRGRPWSMRWPALFVAASIALLLPVPGTANHPQSGANSTAVTFDHDGDNAWWVEVLTKASAGDSVVAMEVRAESGTFRGLQQKAQIDGWTKWGPETAFQIPSGNRVMFRAHTVDGPSGNVATVDSCFFTHPAGAEQCGSTPPPPPEGRWSSSGTAVFDGFPNDQAIGDPDHDGKREVYVATSTALYRLAPVRTSVTENGNWAHVAVGDADRDGKDELFALGVADVTGMWELHRFTFTTTWNDQVVATGDSIVGPMSFGDVDRDGKSELYVSGQVTGDFARIAISQVFFANGAWQVRPVATVSDGDLFGTSPVSLWVGDADADGQSEIVLTTAGKPGYFVHAVDYTTTWTTQRVPTPSMVGPATVVAGNLGDGTRAIAVLDDTGAIYRYTKSGGVWSEAFLATVPGGWGKSLFLGDGDGDGRVELYAASNNAHAYQVRVAGTNAAVTDMGVTDSSEDSIGRLIVGEANNHGLPEVYMAAFNGDLQIGHVYQYDFIPPTPTAFDASFTSVRGNEWWIQASVSASGGSVAKVDVRLNTGEWKPLAKQSWGGWAASYQAVQGTIVQMRATAMDGQVDLSSCRQWIPASNQDAAIVDCAGTPPPGFDATFSGVKGNEWWVQANVAGNQPIAKVEARVNCGPTWHNLPLQSWGGYAKSFQVPNGAKVDFRATSSAGATELSSGYVWPSATPTAAC